MVEMHDKSTCTGEDFSEEVLSAPTGLLSLAFTETHERPPYSNFVLVKYAILGSPNQRLTLSEIYHAISTRFPWFQTAGKSWKNSVRHCLSLDVQFHKVPRPLTEPGKGCYWTVLDTPRGPKRERKRKKKPAKHDASAELSQTHADSPESFPLITPAFRDYATTVPPSPRPPSRESGIVRKHPLTPLQSGWAPYFPITASGDSASAYTTQHGYYTQFPATPKPYGPTFSVKIEGRNERERDSNERTIPNLDYSDTVAPTAWREPGNRQTHNTPAQSGWTPYSATTMAPRRSPTRSRSIYSAISGHREVSASLESLPRTSASPKEVIGRNGSDTSSDSEDEIINAL